MTQGTSDILRYHDKQNFEIKLQYTLSSFDKIPEEIRKFSLNFPTENAFKYPLVLHGYRQHAERQSKKCLRRQFLPICWQKNPFIAFLIRWRELSMLFSLSMCMAWLILGILSAVKTTDPAAFTFSGMCLLALFVLLVGVYFKYNLLSFYFFSDVAKANVGSFSDYLEAIHKEATKNKWAAFLSNILRPPKDNCVYIRVPAGIAYITQPLKERIIQILGVATEFYNMPGKHHAMSNYKKMRFIIRRRCLDLGLAACSFWGITWGIAKVFGIAVVWALTVATIAIFFWRLLELITNIHIWTLTINSLHHHPAFDHINVVSPRHVSLWQYRSADMKDLTNIATNWSIQAVLGFYLVVCLWLANLK